jgi:hypothetical protein
LSIGRFFNSASLFAVIFIELEPVEVTPGTGKIPNPKFAQLCGDLGSEFRIRRHWQRIEQQHPRNGFSPRQIALTNSPKILRKRLRRDPVALEDPPPGRWRRIPFRCAGRIGTKPYRAAQIMQIMVRAVAGIGTERDRIGHHLGGVPAAKGI